MRPRLRALSGALSALGSAPRFLLDAFLVFLLLSPKKIAVLPSLDFSRRDEVESFAARYRELGSGQICPTDNIVEESSLIFAKRGRRRRDNQLVDNEGRGPARGKEGYYGRRGARTRLVSWVSRERNLDLAAGPSAGLGRHYVLGVGLCCRGGRPLTNFGAASAGRGFGSELEGSTWELAWGQNTLETCGRVFYKNGRTIMKLKEAGGRPNLPSFRSHFSRRKRVVERAKVQASSKLPKTITMV